MSRRVRPLSAVLLALALGSGGCALLQITGRKKGEIRLGRGKLVVLPFSMPQRSYFESSFGARLSRATAQQVAQSCRRATVVDVDGLPQSLVQQGAESLRPGEVLDGASVLRIGRQLEADYVLVGEIHDVRAKERVSFGVLRGVLVLSARVMSVEEGQVVWRLERHTFAYPPLLLGQEELPAQERNEDVVLRKVLGEAAKGLALPFTGRPRTLEEDVDRALH